MWLMNETVVGGKLLGSGCDDVCLQEMPLVGFSFLEEALHGLKKVAIFQSIDDSQGFAYGFLLFPCHYELYWKIVWNLCIPTIVIPS